MAIRGSKAKPASEELVWHLHDNLEKKIDLLHEKGDRDYSRLMDVLDHLLGEYQKLDDERVVMSHQQEGFNERLDKLEKQVYSL